MSNINSVLKYKKRFNQRAANWLEMLQDYSEEDLQKKPAKDSWSLALLFDHIIKVAYSYQLLNANSTYKGVEKKGTKNFFGLAVISLNILPKMKIKMESFPLELVQKFTPEVKNKAMLLKDFSKFIKEVNNTFDKLSDYNPKVKQKHPMFGYLNVLEWLSLLEIHMKHHEKQREKIVKKSNL